jgi:hypothetical protein
MGEVLPDCNVARGHGVEASTRVPDAGIEVASPMTERNVSDLVFRYFVPKAAAGRSHEEREATLREELDKLRPRRNGPRVVPASRPVAPHGERAR